MSDDFYCDEVLSGRTPVEVILETGEVLAFRHTRPFWPVHIVVIPKAHVPSLIDLGGTNGDLLHKVLAVVRRVAEQVTGEHGACRVSTNLGSYQDSKHLHFHVSTGEPIHTAQFLPPQVMSKYPPISVKGVVVRDDMVVLLRNERNEWELPGGKLEPNESPEDCVAREIQEELGLAVEPTRILDCWVYEPLPGAFVVIIIYGCIETEILSEVLSHEHVEMGWFRLDEIYDLPIPEGYRRSVRAWSETMSDGQSGQ